VTFHGWMTPASQWIWIERVLDAMRFPSRPWRHAIAESALREQCVSTATEY
jgi:hypothetical protein